MLYFDFPGIAYYPPPKTATKTVVAILSRRLTAVPRGGGNHAIWAPPQYAGYFHLVTTRNPYSRAVSLWSHLRSTVFVSWVSPQRKQQWEIARACTFEQWLADPVASAWSMQRDMQKPYFDAMWRRDGVVRMEHFREDFESLPFVAAMPDVRENVGAYRRDSTWADHYTEKAIGVVRRRWALDFEAAGYSVDFDVAVRESETSETNECGPGADRSRRAW